jgi:hypothetical protein
MLEVVKITALVVRVTSGLFDTPYIVEAKIPN